MTVNAVLMAEAEAAVLARRSEMLEDERSCMSTQYRKASPLPPRSSTCSPVFQRPEGQGDREDEGEGRDWAWSQTGVLGSWSGPRQTHTSSPRYTGTLNHARSLDLSFSHARAHTHTHTTTTTTHTHACRVTHARSYKHRHGNSFPRALKPKPLTLNPKPKP